MSGKLGSSQAQANQYVIDTRVRTKRIIDRKNASTFAEIYESMRKTILLTTNYTIMCNSFNVAGFTLSGINYDIC